MSKDLKNIVNFLFEVGSLRRIPRMHRQTLITDDNTDNIASHSYRVAIIAWLLAKEEGADPYKSVMMALFHDLAEVRSGDHNWVHKKYIKVFEDEILKEQLGSLPYKELLDIGKEYQRRESKESFVAKDADLLDQIFLLREYEWQGNKEASIWLRGKSGDNQNAQFKNMKTETAKKITKLAFEIDPSDWWDNLWTSSNR
jgi:putative hydrolase of HD superfamily